MTRSNSILTETDLGTYYTGPLGPGIRVMYDEYGDSITVEQRDDHWVVTEHRGTTHDNPNQWGNGPTEEEAWRYFIGTDFGPLDETYDNEGYEHQQRRMLGLEPLPESIVREPCTFRITIDVPLSEPSLPCSHPKQWDWVDLVGEGTTYVSGERLP